MNVTVKAKLSKEWIQAIKKVQTLGGVKGVKVGIVEPATNSRTGDNIAEYAFFNEFGTKNIKPRPFMRLTAERHSQEWARLFIQVTGDTLIRDPNVAKRAFTLIGKRAVEDMKATIKSNVPPPNKENTLARKMARPNGKTKGAYVGTLYDTGEMAQSIAFKLYSRAEELNA